MNERKPSPQQSTRDPREQPGAGDPGQDPRMSKPVDKDGDVRVTTAPIPPEPPKSES